MLLVGSILLRSAFTTRFYAPRCARWGPLSIWFAATILIMLDPTRHLLSDMEIWSWCGNNPSYDRINSTNAWPDQCAWSSTQYVCTINCCVSTWQPTNSSDPDTSFEWLPPSDANYPAGKFPGPFGTQRADGTVYYPPGFDAEPPFSVYEASVGEPLALYETGQINPLHRHTPATDCLYGVNNNTGYCFMTNQSLSYEEQLKQLPLIDASKPYNASTNYHVCECNGCTPHEDFAHLSVVGVIFAILCTYAGFICLAVAVGWNANLLYKLSKLRAQWRTLRGLPRAQISSTQP